MGPEGKENVGGDRFQIGAGRSGPENVGNNGTDISRIAVDKPRQRIFLPVLQPF